MRPKDEDSVRITSASRPRSEDIAIRQKRYLISMGIRTLCFVLTIFSIGHWYLWVFLAGSVLLPYVAVVLANGQPASDPGAPDPYEHGRDFRSLES